MSPVQPGDVVQSWVLDHNIGSGSFATVWKAHKPSQTKEIVAAIKIIATDKLSAKLKQSLECEVSILKRISHSNVVKLHEVVEAHNRMYLVMEFCGGGDMADYIRRHKRVSETVARYFMQQLGAGLQELWHHHFVHRDLKPQNLLLLDASAMPVVKIADFGFARDLQPQRLADTLCGSPLYMAPEILQFHKYDAKADLWSVGIILYELVVGRPPFDGGNHVQLLRNIERNEARIPDQIASKLSSCCAGLIHQLLKRNPVERISFEEFFSHPFLAQGNISPCPSASPLESSSAAEPTSALPTIASGMALPPARHSSSGGEELPFAVQHEAPPRRPGPGNSSQGMLHRVSSEPPTRIARQVVVQPPQPQQQHHRGTFFTGLRAATQAGVSSNALRDSMEDEDDYVIIERTPSSSGSNGLRGYSQSAPSGGFLREPIQVPPLPPPLTVPLLVPSASPGAQTPTRSASLSRSLGTLHFTAGLPRFESLKRVAFLLEDLAVAKQREGVYADSLAFRLLSLQVLNIALETAPHSGIKSLQGNAQEEQGSASLAFVGCADITVHMKSIADRAEQVGALLQSEQDQRPLPDVWELTYRAALAFAKAAAVDELLSNYASSLRAYAKAGALFYFMFADGADLPLQPKLQLAPLDLRRLQRYTASVALRHQGCITLLGPSGGSSSPRRLPEPSVIPTGRALQVQLGGSNPLDASLSTHPPLHNPVGPA